MTIHGHEVRSIPIEEVRLAVEAAFLRINQYRVPKSLLAVGQSVIYRAPGGEMHMGPLIIVSLEGHTALVEGFFNNVELRSQLRVMRFELASADVVRDIVHGILSETYPCPHCSKSDPNRPAGQKRPTHRTDN